MLVVAMWYGKNLVQVGEFTGSTWFGMNFSKMTNSMLTVPESAQAAKDDPVKLAASSTRQNKCGKRREKGQDNNQESRQEGKNMQERHIGEHGRNYIME